MPANFEDYTPPQNLIPSDPRFGCGPSLIPVEFVRRLEKTGAHLLGTGHRKAAVKNLIQSLQEGVLRYFGLPEDYVVVVGTGGATFLFDAIGLGLVRERSLHLTCGEFSGKWFKAHHNIPWIGTQTIEFEYGTGPTPEVYAQHLKTHPADVVAHTLNETSTGVMLTPLPEVGDESLLCVDATSGGGQIDCDVSKVDVFFFSLQKVFASEGGTFVAIFSPAAVERALKIAADEKRYIPDVMNLKTHIESARKHQTYNTPSISTLFFFQQQLEAMNGKGYAGVVEEGRRRAKWLYDWAEEKDYLAAYVGDENLRSSAVATIDVDAGIDVASLVSRLEKLRVVYGINSYRKAFAQPVSGGTVSPH